MNSHEIEPTPSALLSQPITRPRLPLGGVMFFLTFVVMSPLLMALGIKGIVVLLGIVLLFIINGRLLVGGFQKGVYAFAAIYLMCAVASGLYWGTETPVMFATLYIVAILVVANLRYEDLDVVVKYATPFIGIVILLGWMGLAYYLAGGGPLGSIRNPDGRDNMLYLTTFSNSFGDNYLRAGGIYDEPGAFSFFICTLCTVRELMHKNRNVTALLLIGGLVTASIAHVVFMAFHFAPYLLSAKKKGNFTVLLVSLLMLGVVLASGRVQGIVQELVIDRAMRFQSGEMENPREMQMLNIVREITPQKALIGFDAECASRTPVCTEALGGDFGENPLTPMVFGGLLVGWPYYLFVMALLIYGASSIERMPLMGLAFVLLQRPYVLEFPYSATVFLVILALAYQLRQRRREQQNRFIDA